MNEKTTGKREDYMKRIAHANGISDAIFYGETRAQLKSTTVLLEWYKKGFIFGLHLKNELRKEFDIFALLDAKEIEDD